MIPTPSGRGKWRKGRGHLSSFAGQQEAAGRAFVRAATLGLSFADVGLAEVARVRGDLAKARARARTVVERCLSARRDRVPVRALDHFLRFGEPVCE